MLAGREGPGNRAADHRQRSGQDANSAADELGRRVIGHRTVDQRHAAAADEDPATVTTHRVVADRGALHVE